MIRFFPRLLFILKEGFRQTIQAKGLSVTVVVVAAATLIQLSIFLGISKALDNALASAQEKFELAVFLAPASNVTDRERLRGFLASDPRVASVKVVTKEEAFQEFRRDPKIARMIQALGENPLTDSLSVVLRKSALEGLDDLLAQLKGNPLVEEVDYGKDELKTMSSLTRTIRWGGVALGLLIFLSSLFIVSNTLSLALWARKEDLALSSRMGTPAWMAWGPYLAEGTFQGLGGAGAVVCLLEVSRHCVGWILQKSQGLESLPILTGGDWRHLYFQLVVLGGILGVTGAFLALRRKWVKDLL